MVNSAAPFLSKPSIIAIFCCLTVQVLNLAEIAGHLSLISVGSYGACNEEVHQISSSRVCRAGRGFHKYWMRQDRSKSSRATAAAGKSRDHQPCAGSAGG